MGETNLKPNEFQTIVIKRTGSQLKVALDGKDWNVIPISAAIDAVGWRPWKNTIHIKNLNLNFDIGIRQIKKMTQIDFQIQIKFLEAIENQTIVEFLFTDPCASVNVLNTNHPHGDNGKYFYFDQSECTKMIGNTDWNSKKYDIIQRGSKIWTGKVIVWDGSTGQYAGSGRYSGRRDAGAAAGNWASGDTLQLKACVEKGI